MGCCVSSQKSFAPTREFDRNSVSPCKIYGALADTGRTETPSSMEEETVKEVLSETPAPKPLPPMNYLPEVDGAQKPVDNKVREEDEIEKKIRVLPIPMNGVAEQPSEISEISSPSECISTTTYTDRMDDGEEVHQRLTKSSPVKLLKNRSLSGDVGLKRETLPTRTLNRRSDQSPVRRNGAVGSVRVVQNRDIGPGTARRGVRAEPPRRDTGDSSNRRSRSPAAARSDGVGSRSVAGRTPSVRKSGKPSPVRGATVPSGSPQKVAEEPNIIDGKLSSQNESLENPLVSLECFIFL